MYTVGQLVRFSALFKVGLIPTDPTTVVFKIQPAAGTVVTMTYGVDAAVVKESAGAYHVDYTLAVQGPHTHRWVGTGDCIAAGEASCEVAYSPF